MPLVVDSKEKLAAAITNVLEDWPLYRRFEYDGSSLHSYDRNAREHADLPSTISLYCEICEGKQRWRLYDGRWSGGDVYFGGGPAYSMYVCKNCDRGRVYFSFCWVKTNSGGVFF